MPNDSIAIREGEEPQSLQVIGTPSFALTPADLRTKIARETELRQIVKSYMKTNMQEDYHYYWLTDKAKKDGQKPALSKSGALNLCSLFSLTPFAKEPHIQTDPDGHLTVSIWVEIFDSSNRIVARGVGMASTRESKYEQRGKWVTEKNLPPETDKATLESRETVGQYGPFTQYYIETTNNPADSYNTVVKMAEKRAMVGAADKLPLVSELFAQDLDITETETRKRAAIDARQKPPARPAPASPTTAAAWYWEPITDLIRSLRDYGVKETEIQKRMEKVAHVKRRAELKEATAKLVIADFEAWRAEFDQAQAGIDAELGIDLPNPFEEEVKH